MDLRPTLAATRFGTGLSPRIAPPEGAEALLEALAGPDHALARWAPPRSDEARAAVAEFDRLRRAQRKDQEARPAFVAYRDAMNAQWLVELAREVERAARTADGFRERLNWFWADHFTANAARASLRYAVASYRADLRPRMTGRFADLLIEAVTHPVMVEYLDQRRSAGPNSARAARGGGLNENLAREVLELHTLGVGGGYTQRDVTELAELMTGLSVDRTGARTFRPAFVEPGPELVMGRLYGGDEADPDDLLAALEDLAMHPETMRHVSRKLAVHFVSDAPDPGMLAAMEAAWRETGGDLMAVYAAMLAHPAAWAPELRKVRRPIEMIAAAIRALDPETALTEMSRGQIAGWLRHPLSLMGQPWHAAPGPDGWPESDAAWITPQGLAARIDWAMRVPRLLTPLPEPGAFVDTALGPLASPRTRFAAGAAETRAAGIGVVLASPEFQRR